MQKDTVSALILLGVAAAYYWSSTDIQDSSLADAVGPKGLPNVLTVLLVIVALAIGARSLMTAPVAQVPVAGDKHASAPWLRSAGFLVLVGLYIVLAPFLGYSDSLFLLLIAVPLYEGMKFSWRIAAVAFGGALFFGVLFIGLLGITQPEGTIPWWLDIYSVFGAPIVAALKFVYSAVGALGASS